MSGGSKKTTVIKASITLDAGAKRATVLLPEPETTGGMALNQVIAHRASIRDYTDAPLTLAQVSQLLWSVQGRTHSRHGHTYRTTPSAGALYPLEALVAAANIETLRPGLYRHRVKPHDLKPALRGNLLDKLAATCAHQDWIAQAPATFVLTAVADRMTPKYGRRTRQYELIEAGHMAQNLCLTAVSLGLGAAVVGAFRDEKLHALLELPEGEEPLYVVTVGQPKHHRK